MKAMVAALLLLAIAPLDAATPCSEGTTTGHACSHVEFVGHLTPAELGGSGEVLNDIWGWVDVANGGTEYAIVGMQDGTAFVRITADGELVPLGRLPASDGRADVSKAASDGHAHKRCHDELCGEENSAWRDIKVYANHAYVVSEAARHGLQVFDLTRLAAVGGPSSQQWNENGYYGGIGHAHNIFINEETARAYVVGHDRQGVAGGLHVLSLANPTSPQLLAELSGDGYTHDVQCVVYDGPDGDHAGRELCFASNEDTVTIWDVTDVDTEGAAGASIVSRTAYAESGYTHQGWLSEDHRYFFVNDELDEMNSGSRTHLRVFDVGNVDAPEIVAHYYAPTLAIDHNNYVHGRWLYQSNYAAGLRVLDVLDPEHPVEAAYFDMQATDTPDFYGTWSNFAFPSGFVALTDVNDGLYVVRPTLDAATTPPDLAIAASLDANDAEVNESVSGTLTLESGAAAAASDVLLTAHLPRNSSFATFDSPDGWTCSTPARVVECRADAFGAESDAAFTFTLAATQAGEFDLYAMAYANEADAAPGDNLDRATLAVTGGSSGDGGGRDSGGGGSLAWLFLLLGALRTLRIRR